MLTIGHSGHQKWCKLVNSTLLPGKDVSVLHCFQDITTFAVYMIACVSVTLKSLVVLLSQLNTEWSGAKAYAC